MIGVVAMACASLFAVFPLQTANAAAPTAEAVSLPSDTASAEVLLARARGDWNRALDAAAWDRDAPSARAAGNEISAALLPLLSSPQPVRAEAVYLLGSIASETVGTYLRSQPSPDLDLVRVYVLHHDDPGLLAALLSDAHGAQTRPFDLAVDLALNHRAPGAELLAGMITSLRPTERERACSAAFGLAPAVRTIVAAALVSSWGSEVPEQLDVGCTALGATTREGRGALERWIRRPDVINGSRGSTRWIAVAAFALRDTGRRHAADGLRMAILDGSVSRSELSQAIAAVAPNLPLRTPNGHDLLTGIARVSSAWASHLAAARLASHEPTLIPQSMDVLRDPHGDPTILATALGVVGLAAGIDESGVSEVRARLVSLREQLRVFHLSSVNQRAVDRWVVAVDRVAACHRDRACLVALLVHGSDAAAARAAYALGSAFLSSLPSNVAQGLVRRLVIRPNAWLLGAVILSVDGCPRDLRGVREAIAVLPGDDFSHGLPPYLAAFESACTDAH